MGKIKVKFDHQLKQSDIVIPLTNSSKDEAGDAYVNNKQEVQQTSIYGIQAPLIKLNNIVVDFSDVVDFSLKCTSALPEVSMIVKDRYNLNATFDSPGVDNELRVQILPKFDNVYKKINLTFYITDIRFDRGFITVKGAYKVPKFISSNIKSFGQINTYQLFEEVSKDAGLGFATNVESNDADKRYIYCDNKSYNELISREIRRSGHDLNIYDYWVDWWNNLVLADMYERYNAKDSQEDMQIWIACSNKEMTEGIKNEPIQVPAALNNNPANQGSELYVSRYNIVNKPGGQMWFGTDRVYSVYEHPLYEYKDHLMMDKDVQKDLYTKYEYLGETYSDFNYLLAERTRDAFLQKIKSHETVEITLKTPLLGIMRGNRVEFAWYINSSAYDIHKSNMSEGGVISEAQTNVPMDDTVPEGDSNQNGQFVMDKTISGQYLVTGCEMKYLNYNWEYRVILSRPASEKQNIITKDE